MNVSLITITAILAFSCGNSSKKEKAAAIDTPNIVSEETVVPKEKKDSVVVETTTIEKEVETVLEKTVEQTDNLPEKNERVETVKEPLTENTASEDETINQDSEVLKANDIVEPEENIQVASEEVKETVIAIQVSVPDHKDWNALLLKYVRPNGDVDYKGFGNDVVALDSYLEALANNKPQDDWSKNEKLAFYINLYNAATVKLIVANYPTKSIKNIKSPWGKKRVALGDENISLGDIEHKILRKMDEPRIHFAINCASYSCPRLVNKAFFAATMEEQLAAATKDFINDTTRNRITSEKAELSEIFKWYKKDFEVAGKSVLDYINPYTEAELSKKTKIQFLKYDWNLNEAK